MYVRGTDHCNIDAVWSAEVEVKRNAPAAPPEVKVVMVFSNSKTGDTMGTCPLYHNPAAGIADNISKETLELLERFLESAEKDLGKLVFESGTTVTGGLASGGAESDEGLTRVGIGGSK